MVAIIDNYDSFTWNLVDIVARYAPFRVWRNDVDVNEILTQNISALLISPGPGKPAESGISAQLLAYYWEKIPILGVCLGHQLLAEVSGGKVIQAAEQMHGKTSLLQHDGTGIFEGIPQDFCAMRYHSLIVQNNSLPLEWKLTAWTQAGEIMAMQHTKLPIVGVQFHPESILSEYGEILVKRGLKI